MFGGLFTRARDAVEDFGQDVGRAVNPANIRAMARGAAAGGLAKRAVMPERRLLPPMQPRANRVFEDGSGVLNGSAFGAGDSPGDVPRYIPVVENTMYDGDLPVVGRNTGGIGTHQLGMYETPIQGGMPVQPNFVHTYNPQMTAPNRPAPQRIQRPMGFGALDSNQDTLTVRR